MFRGQRTVFVCTGELSVGLALEGSKVLRPARFTVFCTGTLGAVGHNLSRSLSLCVGVCVCVCVWGGVVYFHIALPY